MKFWALFLVLVGIGLANAEEIPSVAALGAVSLAEREKAMTDLEKWVLSDQAKAKELLLPRYLECSHPEVRIRLLELLERSYFPVKGFVGITMRSTLWDQWGRLEKQKTALGVRVTNVGKGSPADLSGLKVDDIVLKINEWEVKGGSDVTSQVAEEIQKHPPTTPVSLEVKRGEEVLRVKLKLGILPVPSARARMLLAGGNIPTGLLPNDLQLEISSFQTWLAKQIEKDRKNLIADRRL